MTYKIDDRGGIKVIVFEQGCRPASVVEVQMWEDLAVIRVRCEKAEKDAERYRHMRNNAQFMNRNGPCLYWHLPRFYSGTPVEQLDKCLDASIAKERGC